MLTQFPELFTPALVVDETRLDANIAAMQALCDAGQIELRPHLKTHKSVAVARRQLKAGAAGLTCAKMGEAEAILPAFEGFARREIFLAHSLVDPNQAPRLAQLRAALTDLVLAVTSEAHAPVLAQLVSQVGGKMPVMMALDSGLGREGARDAAGAVRLARLIESLPPLELRGIYTHEGHFYGGWAENALAQWHARILGIKGELEREIGRPLKLWPGCSASAARVAALPGVDAVRPGSYVFGDLALCETTGVMAAENVALRVLATVIDRPAPDLALLDCGSKTLSSDRTPDGVFARGDWGEVRRVSEEHGFLSGPRVNELTIGDRVLLTPAHICPVVNLADELMVTRGAAVCEKWPIEARGKVN